MLEQQYIDIFNKFRSILDDNSAPVLNALRNDALSNFSQLGFPSKKMEDYKNFDIASEFISEYGLNLNRIPMKGNPYFAFACQVPELESNLYYMLNDLFNYDHLPSFEYPKGVFIGSLKEFALKHPDTCSKYYGKIADIKSDPMTAFNTMFVQDGFVVYVPENTIVESPIQLINILKSDFDYLTTRRILVIAEENSQVKLLSCDHTVDDQNYLVTQVNEVFAEKNACVEFYELEENSESVIRITSNFVKQMGSSNVIINSISLKGGKTRNNYQVDLAESHAETYVCGLNIEDKHRLVDNFVHIKHSVAECHSTQLFKYVLQDESIGSFCGRIFVDKDAQKTLAYQSNNNLCVSNESKMFSKPQLEIYADDVKCSHGLTTGQLDDNALFYLRARGISEQNAKLMLMHAFVTDVLDHIRLIPLQEKLSQLVELRLKGEDARCGGCYKCD